MNFHVSLTKRRSDLLKKANELVKRKPGIRFCFANNNEKLKVKFKKINKNSTFDNLESLQKVVYKNWHETPYDHIDTDFAEYNDDELI